MTHRRSRRKPGAHFRLLAYERVWKRRAVFGLLLALGCGALSLLIPRVPWLNARQWIAYAGAGAGLVMFGYALWAQRMSYVRCYPGYLWVQTPLFFFSISYSRIKGTRPTTLNRVFDPERQRQKRGLQRMWWDWLRPYWGRQVVLVELKRFPMSERWLRLWLNPYMFPDSETGLVFLVEDWMGLARQIDQYNNAWRMERAEQRRSQDVRTQPR